MILGGWGCSGLWFYCCTLAWAAEQDPVSKKQNRAGRGGSRLQSQHFGRLRWVDHKVKRSRPSWSTRRNPVSTKNTKISWAWWCVPVIPATWEAEAGELLEPRRRRLWWAEIVPLHSSLGNNSEIPSQKKKERERKYKEIHIKLGKILTDSCSSHFTNDQTWNSYNGF